LKPSTGSRTAAVLKEVLDDINSTETLKAVVCDNTPTNTGYKGGAVALLEKLLKRKLHKIGCMLHWNELPLRKVITDLDGKAVSATNWTGPIGKKLSEDIYQMAPVQFEPVASPLKGQTDILSKDVINDLSADQRLLLEYVLAISSGDIPGKFRYSRPGPPNLARWITTALRILIIYSRTEEPSTELTRIVSFIQGLVIPVWLKHCFFTFLI